MTDAMVSFQLFIYGGLVIFMLYMSFSSRLRQVERDTERLREQLDRAEKHIGERIDRVNDRIDRAAEHVRERFEWMSEHSRERFERAAKLNNERITVINAELRRLKGRTPEPPAELTEGQGD